ncbi:MAG: acyl-CoA thioester hydrolase/BAAT C-terminal domain-containing protein [Gemmataceae bacterium]
MEVLAWWTVIGLLAAGGAFALLVVGGQWYCRRKYLDQVVRIFEERPLFIVPRGKPVPGAEHVQFPTAGGLTLRGCYLRGHRPRRGVILFGPEFGSNRWAALQYTTALLDAGYDIFAYEPRNQGESDKDPGYEPAQWVTDRDEADMRAALAYLKGRPDAPADGVGVFGISKGASVGLVVAAADPWVRCVVTDGAYATLTTMVPYMRQWVKIYTKRAQRVRRHIPNWFYALLAKAAVRRVAARRGVRYLSVERAVGRVRVPLLMIHGEADTYIKPDMAVALFKRATGPDKSLWLVEKAKHNQALNVAGAEYHGRLVDFFDTHLAGTAADSVEMPSLDAPTPIPGHLSAVRAN